MTTTEPTRADIEQAIESRESTLRILRENRETLQVQLATIERDIKDEVNTIRFLTRELAIAERAERAS